ncbi:MAG: hypothetical protein KME45_26065 [Stenomitos rutilans HA7619-LM2]|jgi:uncharacterized protein involved in exopolysaccharide biosynthesis|nr:hypothetical protein [Stenomitos rutilans HA7619-LM2]
MSASQAISAPTTADLFALSLLDLPLRDLQDRLPQPSQKAVSLDWGDATIAPPIAPPKLPSFLNRRTGALAGAAIATVAGTSLIHLADQPNTYEGKFQLRVEPTGNPTASAAPTAANQAALASPSLDYASQVQVLWSPKLLSPVVQQLQTRYADLTYETLSQKLEIAHRDGEPTLEITYQDADPQKVQAVLQKVSHAYLQYSQECRTSLCRELTFVERRLPHLQEQVTIAQQTLHQFQQQHDLTEPAVLGQQLAQRSDVITQQRHDLQRRLTEARTQLAILEKRAAEYVGQPQTGVMEQALQQNDRYQTLLAQFRTIANQITVELARPQPNAMPLQSLKQRYQQVAGQMTEAVQQPIIARRTQAIADFQANKTTDYTQVTQQQTLLEWATAANQVQMLEVSQQAIEQTEAQITQQIKQWAALSRQYDALNLELRFATDNLNLYVAKRAELRQVVPPKTDWQFAEAPAIEQISRGFSLSDPEHRLSLGLLLSFLLVVFVMSIAEQTKPRQRLRRQPAIQPESWHLHPWQPPHAPTKMAIVSTLTPSAIALPLQYQQTTLFLLTAVSRLEARERVAMVKSR